MKLFDLHCDTLYKATDENKTLFESSFHLSIDRGLKYFPWMQCFAVWIPDELRNKMAMDLFCSAYKKLIDTINQDNKIILCKDRDDLKKASAEKKCGAILTVEGGAVLGTDLSNLDFLKQCGTRMMTLTWNQDCAIGSGIKSESDFGLLPFGEKVIEKMEQLDIIVDVSHASDRLFFDVANIAKKPFVASHSNSRSVCNNKRNLTNEQFNIIKTSGGLVGLNFSKGFLSLSAESSAEDIIRHAEHFLSLGGEKTVCLGSDFDGTDMPSGINGIESMENLYELFLKHGYSENLVEDIFFNNAYKFFSAF